MFHIAYVSSATVDFNRERLHTLLEQSREKNHRLEITGLLLFRDGNFMQVIEGEEARVRALFAKICQDPRHRDIFPLFEEPIAAREFPDWSMAFRNLDGEDGRAVPGFSDFLNTAWTPEDRKAAGSRAQRLLGGFKERLR